MPINPINQNKRGKIIANADGTFDGDFEAGNKPAASFSPLFAESWDGGVIGNNVANLSPRAGSGTVTYSDGVAGPFGGTSVGRFDILANGNLFGGTLAGSNSIVINEGDSLWLRYANYFPASPAFCAGSGSGPDGYGITKMFRFAFANNGQRLTLQYGGFSQGLCNSADLYIAYLSQEIDGPHVARYFRENSVTQQPSLTRLLWHFIQLQILFSEDPSIGFARLWLGDQFIGQTDYFQTKPVGDNVLNDLTFGDYWNGWAYQDSYWYGSEIIISKETPNTLDAGGRNYIAPTIRVSDFA